MPWFSQFWTSVPAAATSLMWPSRQVQPAGVKYPFFATVRPSSSRVLWDPPVSAGGFVCHTDRGDPYAFSGRSIPTRPARVIRRFRQDSPKKKLNSLPMVIVVNVPGGPQMVPSELQMIWMSSNACAVGACPTIVAAAAPSPARAAIAVRKRMFMSPPGC